MARIPRLLIRASLVTISAAPRSDNTRTNQQQFCSPGHLHVSDEAPCRSRAVFCRGPGHSMHQPRDIQHCFPSGFLTLKLLFVLEYIQEDLGEEAGYE